MAPGRLLSIPEPGTGGLPVDALYEILIRLPAKDLCRLRAVCRPWRSLLSDPHFVHAHAARHPRPLIVAGYDTGRYHIAYRNEGIICDIMDLSGNVVKRVRRTHRPYEMPENERVVSIQLDLICKHKVTAGPSHILLNPATGAVHALPEQLAKEHAAHQKRCIHYKTFVAFGKVASTGEYKVLRVFDTLGPRRPSLQLYEVFTLDGDNHSQWRGKKGPEYIVYLDLWKSVVIGGIVYFLSYLPDCITSFDLGAEDWRQTLRGPLSGHMDTNRYWHDFSLATLSGCLVVVHQTHTSVDLWFLTDTEKSLWIKQHTIPIDVLRTAYKVGPLLTLDDGRIVLLYLGSMGMIKSYNPRTGAFTDVTEMGYCVAVGLYTGNLLSLPTGASS